MSALHFGRTAIIAVRLGLAAFICVVFVDLAALSCPIETDVTMTTDIPVRTLLAIEFAYPAQTSGGDVDTDLIEKFKNQIQTSMVSAPSGPGPTSDPANFADFDFSSVWEQERRLAR